MDKKGGVSRVSVKKFLSHSAENFAGEPFCDVFQKISGSEKDYGKEAGGSIKIFCRKILSNSAAKNDRGTLLCCVSEPFW